ncbi:hypothetical protein K438DRAFT_1611748 [Mycena galopus ATCC 62051]|nr:hypothetical protein K438DRAFT_1611748 [Mycena galopus ATCC 62051]
MVVKILAQTSSRVAILGGGGMGKTSLARAILHHPNIVAGYENRVFVDTESATNRLKLAEVVGACVRLKPEKDLTRSVVQYFSGGPSCLLILDNLETSWEPKASRSGVEDFLSLLSEVSNLALVITMRGAERPAKVRWTRPFLPPLERLSDSAARQTFIDIADDFHNSDDMNQLLHLVDNMPLAVELVAHLVDHESCSNVLARWDKEKISLLSGGYDKRSNISASIEISLSSSRIASSPNTKILLSLLSILPDGLSDNQLAQINLPISDIMACKSVLLATALAYLDNAKRLKSLSPIREHMQLFYKPTTEIIRPIRTHLHLLLGLYQKYRGTAEMGGITDQIASNLGNLHQVMLRGLNPANPDLAETIECTILLSSFRRMHGHGRTELMDHIPAVFPQPCNHRLEAQFIIETFSYALSLDPKALIAQATCHFAHFQDLLLEGERLFFR